MTEPKILVNALSVTYGGALSYAVNLIRELDRDSRGFEITLLVPPGELEHTVVHHISKRTIRLPGPGPIRVASRVLLEQTFVPGTARGFDALYCVADLSPIATCTPTVVAARNLNIYDSRFYDTPRLRTLRSLAKAGLRRANRVLTPSAAAADEISRLCGVDRAKFGVVPHGVSADSFLPVSPLSVEHPFVFLPAALEKHKNIEVLIRALAHTRDQRLEAWIAGPSGTDPEYAAHLQRLTDELNLRDRVRFLGPVPYSELPRYYRSASALIFPSRLETFGHPLLEAMLCETPLLVSDLPVFREIAGDVARYFRWDDPRQLAAEIDERFADSAATDRRVARGRERARDFTWRRSIDELAKEIRAVIPPKLI